MNPQEMTGIELLRASWDGKLPRPTMAETIPMTGIELAEGYVKMGARADGRHLNPLGGVHGGFAATVLDSVTGCAVHTTLGRRDILFDDRSQREDAAPAAA